MSARTVAAGHRGAPRSQTLFWLLALVLVTSPITRVPGGAYYLNLQFKIALLVVTIAFWIVGGRASTAAGLGDRIRSTPPVALVLGALVAWSAFRLALAGTLTIHSTRLLLSHLTALAFFFPFFAVARAGERTRWQMARIVVAAGAAVGSLAILQYIVMQFGVLRFLTTWIIPKLDRDLIVPGDPSTLPAWGYRSWGSFHHPNLLGIFLGLVFPIAVIGVLGSRRRSARGCSILALLLIAGGLFCSGSRGGWLNVGVGMLVLAALWIRQRPKRTLIAVATAVSSSLAILGLLFRDDIRQYLRLENVLSNRDIIWKNTWTMVMEHPILGNGPGTFSRSYLQRFDFPTEIERGTALRELASFGRIDLLDHWHAHNVFLHHAAELGIVGAVLVLLVFIAYVAASVRGRRTQGSRDSRSGLLLAGCTAALMGNLAHSVLETSANVAYPAIGVPFICVLAMGLASMQSPRGSAA